jgi:hypothetical protein
MNNSSREPATEKTDEALGSSRKFRRLEACRGLLRYLAPSLLSRGEHQNTFKGDSHEDADRDNVQENPSPKNQPKSDALQTLRRTNLFSKFSQSPSRREDALIKMNER